MANRYCPEPYPPLFHLSKLPLALRQGFSPQHSLQLKLEDSLLGGLSCAQQDTYGIPGVLGASSTSCLSVLTAKHVSEHFQLSPWETKLPLVENNCSKASRPTIKYPTGPQSFSQFEAAGYTLNPRQPSCKCPPGAQGGWGRTDGSGQRHHY